MGRPRVDGCARRPSRNGAEVAEAERAGLPGLPIVLASGYADTAAIEDGAGPDTPILRKPFKVDDLKVAVAEAFIPHEQMGPEEACI